MIAVFSDAHANPYALKAVLQDIRSQSPEKIIFLGDVLTGPDPKWTTAILADSGCFPISGNVEHWIINGDIYGDPARDGELYRDVREKMTWIVDRIETHRTEYDIEKTASLVRSGKGPIPHQDAYIEMLRTGKHWRNFHTPNA